MLKREVSMHTCTRGVGSSRKKGAQYVLTLLDGVDGVDGGAGGDGVRRRY